MSDDEKAIRDLLARRDAAIAAGDAAGAVESIAPGAISYDLPTPLQFVHDRDGAVRGLTAWFDTWDGPVTSVLADPTVLVSGDLAVAYGLAHMTGDKKGQGPQDLWFRETVVLRRDGGTWRIVHAHASVPFHMDGSGRAATDLSPADAA